MKIILVTVLTFLTAIQGKSLYGGYQEIKVWEPDPRNFPCDITREEYMRCGGMCCDMWDRVQEKISRIHEMQYRMSTSNMDGPIPFDINSNDFKEGMLKMNGSLDGCIYLTEENADNMMERMESDMDAARQNSRTKRSITKFRDNRWTRFPINYKIDHEHEEFDKETIRKAFDVWQENTCITFKEAQVDETINDNHILVTNRRTGCHSYVGKVPLIPQVLNLQYNCLWEFGTALHEIAHALGLWHEQQRPDRDNHIDVNYNNLGFYRGQYSIQHNVENLSVPFDYGSSMLYSPLDGSSTGQAVMEAKDKLYQRNMGQRVELSWWDKAIINRAYCNNSCSTIKLSRSCQRGGYQHPKHCERCMCPDGFSGRYCQDIARPKNAKSSECGQNWVMLPKDGSQRTISSPGYDERKQRYENNQECHWLVQAPPGYRVVMKFVDAFNVYCHHQGECHHWVEVRYGKQVGQPGPRFCCQSTPTDILRSETNEMSISFKSNFRTYARHRGFKAEFYAERDPNSKIPETGSNNVPELPTPEVPSVTAPPAPNPGQPWSWSCNFESSSNRMCDMTQDRNDEFDWTLTNKRTPSHETGPENAFDGQYYIFIETSNPRRYKDRATIFLPEFEGGWGDVCVSFYYHMYGFHTDTLLLFSTDGGNRREHLRLTGQKGNAWRHATVNVNLNSRWKLGFTGIRGRAFSGDISLDNISVKNGGC